MIINYNTRDAKGVDFVKQVQVKEFKSVPAEYDCPICDKHYTEGIPIKQIVSSSFTDWAYVGDYICQSCSRYFSLYFYNYISDADGIRLLNVRELRDELCRKQKPPFMVVITTSQKKHLFYRSKTNYTSNQFAVNLETETIYTTPERMKYLFCMVEALQTLGASKEDMKNGEIRFNILQKTGKEVLRWLDNELQKSREIQIPLYCGQKQNYTEEEALCIINLTLKA